MTSAHDGNGRTADASGKSGSAPTPGGRAGVEPAKPQRKRFYEAAAAIPNAMGAGPVGSAVPWRVTLDGRAARTPGGRILDLPSRALAEAVAAEWEAQRPTIDPARMPLTRLVNTVLDGVAGKEAAVAADVVKYAGSDLLCYRADAPAELVARQDASWSPVLAWAQERLGCTFKVTTGLMPVAQGAAVEVQMAAALECLDAYRIAALHIMTTLTGSALLALACHDGHLHAEAAWQAAHVDEDWQIAQWGEDDEAAARRARRWQDMAGAAHLVALLGSD